jgi:hypothetical protein
VCSIVELRAITCRGEAVVGEGAADHASARPAGVGSPNFRTSALNLGSSWHGSKPGNR